MEQENKLLRVVLLDFFLYAIAAFYLVAVSFTSDAWTLNEILRGVLLSPFYFPTGSVLAVLPVSLLLLFPWQGWKKYLYLVGSYLVVVIALLAWALYLDNFLPSLAIAFVALGSIVPFLVLLAIDVLPRKIFLTLLVILLAGLVGVTWFRFGGFYQIEEPAPPIVIVE